ncbi:hypothetical protein Leryth_022343 [Lithospermum erythrorhizon]|nr:hypothetical protein Leryth_022343 [Lithospermum erythrorhizon]
MENIAKRWKLLSGMNNWEGLLDPLDLDLRKYILHYGDMTQATYDTFNSVKQSKYAGSSRYTKKNLFSKVGLVKGNKLRYEVTKYLYATSSIPVPDAFICKSLSQEPWTKESNWIGYVAVATDEGKVKLGRRDIVIAWRGTILEIEWVKDFEFLLVPGPIIFGDDNTIVQIHQGWYSMYTSEDPESHFNVNSARTQVVEEVKRLVEKYKNEEISITVTGHSLGASLATLNAVDIVANGLHKPEGHNQAKGCLVTAFLFGSPRVGNSNFKDLVSGLENLRVLRVRNALDSVTEYPFTGYMHVGVQLTINTAMSCYFENPGDVNSWHALEVYLHGVAGTQGSKGGFKLEVNRDIALVNKYLDILKDKFLVQGSWWVEKNKGMVQQHDGSWELKDHEHDQDDP